MLSIGLMSGTSMDGIDAALLETDGTPRVIKEMGHAALAYEPAFKTLLKAAEYAIKKNNGHLQQASLFYPQAVIDYLTLELKIDPTDHPSSLRSLKRYLALREQDTLTLEQVILHSTELHATCVNQLLKEAGYQPNQIEVIGYHGQTLLHWPNEKLSIAVGDGQYLANRLGIKVINDFRSKDIAAGGQGAPLAPLYHQALAIRDGHIPLAVLNCGGIANLTVIRNTTEMDLLGFDTGPGNALLDCLVRQRTQGAQHMDVNGEYGRRGSIIEPVLQALYEKSMDPAYFKQPPPKSLDYQDMRLIDELNDLTIEDACRTLAAFTADTIVTSVDSLDIELPTQWILAGGGWKNPVITEELIQRLNKKWGRLIQVHQAHEIGWNSDALEAQIFAYLAVRSLQKKPISFPGTTRVPEALTGGNLYYPHYS